MLEAEVTTTALFTVQSIVSYKLTHKDEVTKMDGFIKLNVQSFLLTRDKEVSIELLTKSLQLLQTFLKAFLSTTHTYVFPHNMAEFLVDRVNRTLTMDTHQAINLCINSLFSLIKFRTISRNFAPKSLVCEIILNRIRQYKVTICQALHQC